MRDMRPSPLRRDVGRFSDPAPYDRFAKGWS
jgi:hypothetical protein